MAIGRFRYMEHGLENKQILQYEEKVTEFKEEEEIARIKFLVDLYIDEELR